MVHEIPQHAATLSRHIRHIKDTTIWHVAEGVATFATSSSNVAG
ncbi:MAG TPA: hypothetical protein V6D22_15020 [Candidatus Obscuribacterales bacterium]